MRKRRAYCSADRIEDLAKRKHWIGDGRQSGHVTYRDRRMRSYAGVACLAAESPGPATPINLVDGPSPDWVDDLIYTASDRAATTAAAANLRVSNIAAVINREARQRRRAMVISRDRVVDYVAKMRPVEQQLARIVSTDRPTDRICLTVVIWTTLIERSVKESSRSFAQMRPPTSLW